MQVEEVPLNIVLPDTVMKYLYKISKTAEKQSHFNVKTICGEIANILLEKNETLLKILQELDRVENI